MSENESEHKSFRHEERLKKILQHISKTEMKPVPLTPEQANYLYSRFSECDADQAAMHKLAVATHQREIEIWETVKGWFPEIPHQVEGRANLSFDKVAKTLSILNSPVNEQKEGE